MAARQAFIKPEHQQFADVNGFVLVEDFLQPADIEQLTAAYNQFPAEFNKGFHATPIAKNAEYRRYMSDKVIEVVKPNAEEYLLEYKPLVGAFAIKEPTQEGFFDFHLDWSMVDEKQFSSYSIWVPLCDINEVNGQLYVLKGSHLLGYNIRGGPSMFTYTEAEPNGLINNKYESLPFTIKAGTAVIYDHRLFHGSPRNGGNVTRLAINCSFGPAEATSLHYSVVDDYIVAYEANYDFYTSYKHGNPVTALKEHSRIKIEHGMFDDNFINAIVGKAIPNY